MKRGRRKAQNIHRQMPAPLLPGQGSKGTHSLKNEPTIARGHGKGTCLPLHVLLQPRPRRAVQEGALHQLRPRNPSGPRRGVGPTAPLLGNLSVASSSTRARLGGPRPQTVPSHILGPKPAFSVRLGQSDHDQVPRQTLGHPTALT